MKTFLLTFFFPKKSSSYVRWELLNFMEFFSVGDSGGDFEI